MRTAAYLWLAAAWLAAAPGAFSSRPQPRLRRTASARAVTDADFTALQTVVIGLLGRLDAAESEIAALRTARAAALSAELAALNGAPLHGAAALDAALSDTRGAPRSAPPSWPQATTPSFNGLRTGLAARAAFGEVVPPFEATAYSYSAKVAASFVGRGGKNDEFLDDDLDDLLEIGGDPSFLEYARETPRAPASDGATTEPSWDGEIDETAYFD
ncbi:hypothetical protein M885DRAFT_508766, partial [Pelagophyceae sp. CCMP2097]